MSQRRTRPLSLPLGLLTAALVAASALAVVVDLVQSPRERHDALWISLVYGLAGAGMVASLLAMSAYAGRSQSLSGRLFLAAVQFYLVAALIFLAGEDREVQGGLLAGCAAVAAMLGVAVVRSEERFLRVLDANRDVASTVSELPKCAACSTPLSVRSRSMPWAVLVAGECLLAVGAYRWWSLYFTQPGVSIERTVHLLAAQMAGTVAIVWWLLYRRFWWRCSGCGNEGPARTAVRRPAVLAPGAIEKSFGEPKPADLSHTCPICGGPAYSEGPLMRLIAGWFGLVGVAILVGGGLTVAWGIEEGKPSGYVFGLLLVAAGSMAVWIGFRYLSGSRAALRCELCGNCFTVQAASGQDAEGGM